jgi:RNA polymerase sigma-70 factor (ECF subfamily)
MTLPDARGPPRKTAGPIAATARQPQSPNPPSEVPGTIQTEASRTLACIASPAVTKPLLPSVFFSGVSDERDDGYDRTLLEELASGRREALAELYDRHSASLFRHAIVLTGRRAEAEDLVQVVFVKLATTGAQLLGVRTPVGYLHRMLKTTWLDSRRRTTTGERALEQGTTASFSVPSASIDDSIDIAHALDALPPLQREVIVLHVVEGFSFVEVGRLTGVSLFTVAARYRLAVVRLRRALMRMAKDRV